MHTLIIKVALGACSMINQWEGPGYVLSVSFNGKLVMHADLYIDFTVKAVILFTPKYWEKFYTIEVDLQLHTITPHVCLQKLKLQSGIPHNHVFNT